MNVMKKALAILLAMGMAASLAACGGSSSSSAPAEDKKAEETQTEAAPAGETAAAAEAAPAGETAAAAEADTAQTAAHFDKITFGTNAEFPPFEFVSSTGGVIGEFDGIDMAIAKEICDNLGAEPVINNIEFDSLLIALQNGQIDAVIAGMTVTDDRKQSVDFTTPYYTATQVMIVKEDSDIQKATDMADKKIAVIQGYTGEICVKKLGYSYDSFKKGTDAILELMNGKADVVVIDSATAQKYVSDNPGLKIVEDSEQFASEEYAIAVKKGNTELLNALNAEIEKLLAANRIAELGDQYAVAE